MKVLITGIAGLVGSSCLEYFDKFADEIVGIENDQRMNFFGPGGSIRKNWQRIQTSFPHVVIHNLDIRDFKGVENIIQKFRPDVIIHAAAQPSHDLAGTIKFDDFNINATSTLNLLESVRIYSPNCIFCFMSTNKVYGSAPNSLPLQELPQRWDFNDKHFQLGIPETLTLDQNFHSFFGISKLAADLLVQEYGYAYGMKTACFRAGCITGPAHTGVELHGFLSYLVKSLVNSGKYVVIGYGGKQVRDQIHALDLASAIHEFVKRPKSAAVYNIGGGFENSTSILEAIACLTQRLHLQVQLQFEENPRKGDHICYYSDLRKFKTDYPEWKIRRSLLDIYDELIANEIANKKMNI